VVSAHESACSIFGTVLGPRANKAHRDHFHLYEAAGPQPLPLASQLIRNGGDACKARSHGLA